jgi:putative transposase
VNKLIAGPIRLLPKIIHAFEDLEKEDPVNRKRAKKVRRKRNARTPWRVIRRRMSEIASTAYVILKNTSRGYPRCRFVVETREVIDL